MYRGGSKHPLMSLIQCTLMWQDHAEKNDFSNWDIVYSIII